MDADLLKELRKTAIIGLISDGHFYEHLVLKGGNAVDIVYGCAGRSSLDLDFSLAEKFEESLEELQRRIETAIGKAFVDKGYVAFDVRISEKPLPEDMDEEMKKFWGGYSVDFKVISREKYKELGGEAGNKDALRRFSIPVGKHGSTKLKVDISKFEHVAPKSRVQIDEFSVFVYTPAMIVAEKLRSLCQQDEEYAKSLKKSRTPRAKDLFDIHAISEKFPIDFEGEEFRMLIKAVFAIKRVPLEILGKLESLKDFHEGGFKTVKDTVLRKEALKAYDFYFDYVVAFRNQLEPLWKE